MLLLANIETNPLSSVANSGQQPDVIAAAVTLDSVVPFN